MTESFDRVDAMQTAMADRLQAMTRQRYNRPRARSASAGLRSRPASPAQARRPARAGRGRRRRRSALPRSVHDLARARPARDRRRLHPVGAADRHLGEFHLRLWRPLRSVPRQRRHASRHRSRRPDGHPGLCDRRRRRRPLRMEQWRLWQPHRDQPRPGHPDPFRSPVAAHRPARPAHPSRPADRPDGLDRPLDRQPPPLRGAASTAAR